MPFVVAEFDPREISFSHHDRAFRCYNPPQAVTSSVHPGLEPSRLHYSIGVELSECVGGQQHHQRLRAAAARRINRRSDLGRFYIICCAAVLVHRVTL
jgi:hypothetical protein